MTLHAAIAAADAHGLRLRDTGDGRCTVECRACGWALAGVSAAKFEAGPHGCVACSVRAGRHG